MKRRMRNLKIIAAVVLFLINSAACREIGSPSEKLKVSVAPNEKPRLEEIASAEIRKVLESANRQIEVTKTYDPAYVEISYPNGDIPLEKGVCTDVVIRAFRAAGVDLQKEVHEDMTGNFAVYPQKWNNLPKPDTNIDHRRVPNLQTFFERRGKSLPVTRNAKDFLPGDVVAWDIDGKGMTHIGVVSNVYDEWEKRYLIIHNMGWGTKLEDRLLEWKIIGHYRYF
jgi:uncharacterized protein